MTSFIRNDLKRKIWKKSNMKFKLLSIAYSLSALALIFFLIFSIRNHGYKVIYTEGPKHSKSDYSANVNDGLEFVKIFAKEYKKVINREVHSKFQQEFLLLKQNAISAKLVISSFDESLLYIFPDNKNQIFVDLINFPVQSALCYGFIDLNNPKTEVDLRKIKIKIPLPEAMRAYSSQPGRITMTAGDGGSLFSSAKMIFRNCTKIFSFHRKTILGLMNEITFEQTSQHYLQINGQNGYHNYKINGMLLIISENTFDWTFELAKKIGRQMAENEIKALLTKSKFFRLSLADKKLRPKAENIAQKLSRSEKQKNAFQYPMWEFKKDVFELKEAAKRLGIDSSYVDELLKEPSLIGEDGTLFVYFPNEIGFMIQWSLMNIIFVIFIAALTFIKFNNTTIWSHVIRLMQPWLTNFSIITLITMANGWVLSKKPDSITIKYWIFPCVIFLLCIALTMYVINSSSQNNSHK